jgi:hypothetical protein
VRLARARLGLNAAKAFIPLDPEGGREAEVDWGMALAISGGKPTTVKFFALRSRYAATHFVRGYPLNGSRPSWRPTCTPSSFATGFFLPWVMTT